MDARTARRMLDREHQRLQGILDGTATAGEAMSLSASTPGDSADVVGRILEREIAESVHAHARGALREVDEAFARLDNDTFGTCEVCGDPIEDARLQVRPATRTCVAHARAPAVASAAGSGVEP